MTSMIPPPAFTRPNLKVVGLQIEGFRALRRVDWPAEGLGWNGTVPDIVMVGGGNGSGKTLLLELIAEAAQILFVREYRRTMALPNSMRLFFEMDRQAWGRLPFRLEEDRLPDPKSLLFSMKIQEAIANGELFDVPSIVYLPSDRRLAIPQETYKAAGRLNTLETFFHRFASPTQWKDSLEAALYSARWTDLNAKEEGYPERAIHFDSYAQAFQAFFGHTKRLVWIGGELFVRINETGAIHPLMELSSGEQQALIMAAELHRRWRPGSLILIDEPELHFHTAWQTTLYALLDHWQKERGGQVIITTQSPHLFRIAAPGTTVMLGG